MMRWVIGWGVCCLQVMQGFAELSRGAHPYGSLIAMTDSSTGHLLLYGMTVFGGSSNRGVLFSYDIEARRYTNLVEFTGTAARGAYPYGALTAKNGLLYGMTVYGGAYNRGVLFSYDTNTGHYTDLIDFTGVMRPHYGAFPHGSLTAREGRLYGLTTNGSAFENSGYGVLFSYDIKSRRYTDLINLTGTVGPNRGAYPNDSLTARDGLLYGMTAFGGVNDYGVLFSYDTNTGKYSDIIDFTGTSGPSFGAYPYGSLTARGELLYGMTAFGGSNNHGVLFSYNTQTSSYTALIDFTGIAGPASGANPYGSPIARGELLYGTTANGGASNHGVLFSYDTKTQSYMDLIDFTGTTGPYRGANPHSSLTATTDPSTGLLVLYGTTANGGFNNRGVLFSYDAETGRYTVLVDL